MYSPKSSRNPHGIRVFTQGTCRRCGQPTKRTTRVYCSRECAVRRGPESPTWKGGVSKINVRYTNRFRERHPEKVAAHRLVAKAIRRGDLTRLPCEACGRPDGVEAHHEDYRRPLDVVWLCDHDHKLLHRLKVIAASLVLRSRSRVTSA